MYQGHGFRRVHLDFHGVYTERSMIYFMAKWCCKYVFGLNGNTIFLNLIPDVINVL